MSNSLIPSAKIISQLPKWITLVLSLAAVLIAIVLWATSAHSEQKAWTVKEIRDTKVELKADAKEKYVPIYEWTAVKKDIKYQSDAIDDVKDTLKDINNKLDNIGSRRSNGRSRGNDAVSN